MIEDRIDPAQKSPAEGRETVREQIVQSVAFVDTSNFYTAAFVSSFHMFLIETLAEFLTELLFEVLYIALERFYSFLKGRSRDRNRVAVVDLHRPAE